MNKQLIITGDDFGLALAVNEAIEQAHQRGVLTTTSLLIGAAAAQDAVARAHRNPALRVGLHVAVCEGTPVLPPSQIPSLVDAKTGLFLSPGRAFLALFLRKGVRSQLQAELRAQFQAFRDCGLAFDHVNGHNHMQLHPVVLPVLIQVAREFGVRSMRLSYEPLWASWRAMRSRFWLRCLPWLAMRPWGMFVKSRFRKAGLVSNDQLFGIYDCGAMDTQALLGFLRHLPSGVSEIHCHPATRRCPEIDATMPDYRHEQELEALTSCALAAALAQSHVHLLAGFSALLPDSHPEFST
jgi:hopanoid biosynthesis associated protein HpnK